MTAFYLDEDSQAHAVVSALRSAGLDVLTTAEAARNGSDDLDQLRFATSANRVIITANRADFARLHLLAWQNREPHTGIVVWEQSLSIGDGVRAILNLLEEYQDYEPDGRIEYLTNWLE